MSVRQKVLHIGLAFLLLLAGFMPQIVNAAQITGRSFTLSNSDGAASGVTYTFGSSALPTSTAVRSVVAEACTTASGTCTTPTGFTGASAGLTSQPTGLGSTSSWTDDSNAGNLRITHASNVTAPSGAVAIVWNTVTNPTADNTTYYLRVTTYSDSAYTTAIDSGVVAVSTAEAITVSASVDETLTFCVGTSGVTSSSCSGATGNSVALGSLTTSTTGSGTSQLGVATNAGSGYSITINGTTLTSGGNTITALAAQTASSQGSEQFGVNLRDNATPNVGTDADGSGTATPTANYNTVDQFRFVTGDSIASKNSADAFRRFHVAYMANIANTTEPGSYSATMTYIATPTF
jgi:hypothetical protein